ncbi:hypothetical protein SCLCIDRAFT_1208556 [Scleroderma citrinum Foug A]|uniref:Uncharacterized protein n=1 Tax=Scleroderma citrinum Foug A TaxID=1036808 RepID=A0A0C3AW20_9AGAM|nr:hypothetical protein SCLCIDRAFT_1208556 [Scleroderma citrinum Foug A]
MPCYVLVCGIHAVDHSSSAVSNPPYCVHGFTQLIPQNGAGLILVERYTADPGRQSRLPL